MKLNFYSLSLGALMLGMLASCSNDMEKSNGKDTDGAVMKIQQQPDFYVYTGGNTLLNTMATTKAEAEEGNKTDKYDQKEVEINLSINDIHVNDEGEAKYDVEDLISKLSIHLRAATDVTVVLPVTAANYCDQDDFAIYGNHLEGALLKDAYKALPDVEKTHYQTVTVGEYNITLTVTFGEENITITTEDMSQDILDYCNATYADGLNIEIYNYFKGSAVNTIAALKELLDGSSVTFTVDDNVDFYINAFAQNEDGTKFGQDCTVTPDTDVFDAEPVVGEHFNGSVWNVIYSKAPEAEVED